ncbi:MAG: tetraacyldisaccharide 4'-kinase [Woeseia sp.]
MPNSVKVEGLARKIWYGRSRWFLALLPLSLLFAVGAAFRRELYRRGVLRSFDIGTPVIVVGNITTGGTGKTPVTMWFASRLRERGFKPGIVSRGYGGRVGDLPLEVTEESDPGAVGDEPLLMAQRLICPVVVHPNRVRAAKLLAAAGCDVVIADDGLQHYQLRRRFEIAVVDGARGFGNGQLLPAGPLREPLSRLRSVDRIMVQGGEGAALSPAAAGGGRCTRFELVASSIHGLQEPKTLALDALRGRTVHAIAAIGHPRRFFRLLEEHGASVIPHEFPDHAQLSHSDLRFDDGLDVLMTEKDAVKIARPAPPNCWYVAVDLRLAGDDPPEWLENMANDLRRGTTNRNE